MKEQMALSHYLKAQCYGRLSKHEEMKASLREAFDLDESLKMKALDDPAFEHVFGEEKACRIHENELYRLFQSGR